MLWKIKILQGIFVFKLLNHIKTIIYFTPPHIINFLIQIGDNSPLEGSTFAKRKGEVFDRTPTVSPLARHLTLPLKPGLKK